MPMYIPQLLVISHAFALGVIFGSFANMLAYRLPLGKSIVRPASFCPDCNKRIKPLDLIPIVSFFMLRGMCRQCSEKISFKYPIVEFFCGLLFAATAFLYQFPAVAAFAVLAFALLVVALIDIQEQKIPDSMLVVMVAAAIFWIISDPNSIQPFEALIGAAAGAIPLYLLDRITLLLFNRNGFGFGDVKLIGAAGLFLGWHGVLTTYFIAFIAGGIAAVYMLVTKKIERGDHIAFGPFVCLGTIAAAWSHAYFGEHLISFML